MQVSPQGEISSVPVSHRDNSGAYSAVQEITGLRQSVGCVYQYLRRSPRLHINASLTLHLCMACLGGWPTHFLAFLISTQPLYLHLTWSPPCFFFFLFFFFLFLLHHLPPSASFFPNSSFLRCMPRLSNHSVCVCVCVCQAYPSRLIYYATGETKVQEMEVRTHR